MYIYIYVNMYVYIYGCVSVVADLAHDQLPQLKHLKEGTATCAELRRPTLRADLGSGSQSTKRGRRGRSPSDPKTKGGSVVFYIYIS